MLVNISTLIVASHNMCSGGEREICVRAQPGVTVSVTITNHVTIIISVANNSIETCQMMKVASGSLVSVSFQNWNEKRWCDAGCCENLKAQIFIWMSLKGNSPSSLWSSHLTQTSLSFTASLSLLSEYQAQKIFLVLINTGSNYPAAASQASHQSYCQSMCRHWPGCIEWWGVVNDIHVMLFVL